MLLIIPLIPATLLTVVWFSLLMMANQNDWIAAAYSKVVDNRMQIQKLKQKDIENTERMSHYHGLSARVMKLFIEVDSSKKQAKLEKENASLQNGDLRSVNILDIPGYVLQRKFDFIGLGAIHKNLMGKCIELYGKKYAVNKTKQLFARLLSYPILGVSVSLALGTIMLGRADLKTGLIVMIVGTLLALALVYALYDEVDDQLRKRRAAISRQFPNVVSKLALLVTSGMILDRAWRETAMSQESELYVEMRKTANELDNMVQPTVAYTNFINRCNTKETTKLASAIIQSQSKGNAEIGVLLKGMAHDAWQERRHTAKRESEAANSKLMIPTMLLFVAILVMIMVPVAMNFSSL